MKASQDLIDYQETMDAKREFLIKKLEDVLLIQGKSPRYHRKQMMLLRKNWRPLYDAVWELVNFNQK